MLAWTILKTYNKIKKYIYVIPLYFQKRLKYCIENVKEYFIFYILTGFKFC